MTSLSDLPSYIFGGENTSVKTPEDLARKRQLVDAMMSQEIGSQTPRNLGEGLSAIGKALMIRKARGDLSSGVDQVQAGQDKLWSSPVARQALGMAPIADAVMSQQNQSAPQTAPLEPITQTPLGQSGNIQTSQANPNLPPALTSGQPVAQAPSPVAMPAPMPVGAASGQLQALLEMANKPEFAFANPVKQKVILDLIQNLQGQNTPLAKIQLEAAQQGLSQGKISLDQARQRQAGLEQIISQLPPDQQAMVKANPDILSTIAASKFPGKPTWGQIGTDMYGRTQYGYPPAYDSSKSGEAQTAMPQTNNGTSQTDLTNVTGEDYLANLTKVKGQGYANQVRGIIEGRMPYPTGMLIKTPYGQQLATDVTQADPTFEAANSTARAKLRSDAVDGPLGKSTNAISTALTHLNQVADDAMKLPNGNFTPLNQAKSLYTNMTGGDAYSNFNTSMGKVAAELTTAYRNGGGNEADILRELDNVSTASSPTQILGSLLNSAKLLKGKIDANQKQVDDGLGPLSKKIQMTSPEIDKTIARLESLHAQAIQGSPLANSNDPALDAALAKYK